MTRTKFRRKDSTGIKSLGDKWRKPRGNKNAQRLKKKGQIAMPNIGYGTPRATRGLHPSGLRDVLIFTPSELAALDKAKDAVRIGSSVGTRKRIVIVTEAKKLGLRVLNPGKAVLAAMSEQKEVEKK